MLGLFRGNRKSNYTVPSLFPASLAAGAPYTLSGDYWHMDEPTGSSCTMQDF